MKESSTLALLALTALTSITSFAQELSEEEALTAAETRQSVFRLLSWNMDPMAQMLRNERPFDEELVARSAERIGQLAQMINDAFGSDTREHEVQTKARDAIWDNKQDFAAKAADLVEAAGKLRSAVSSGERSSVLRGIAGIGQACGACHDVYRD